jgi:nucleotide-binding universal stress UspA family protein
VPEGVTEALLRSDDEHANAVLREGVGWLRDHGLAARGLLLFGDPLVHIAETAKRVGADLIVVGHRRRSRLEKWWRDSDEQTLLDRVECSVLAAVPHG